MDPKIIAINKDNGERTEVVDLYWFEEERVHSFDDDEIYSFEIYVRNVLVYKSNKE